MGMVQTGRFKLNNSEGFTLLEILVAASIFALIMTAASGIFTAALHSQSRILTEQMAISNTSYALEYMSRALRMAKKDVDGECLVDEFSGGGKCNYGVSDDEDAMRFLTHDKKCVEFYLEGGQIKRKKSGTTSPDSIFNNGQAFTSGNLDIEKLQFLLEGECQSDKLQPAVTIIMQVGIDEKNSFKTQTTVTQRNLDVLQ